MTLDFLLTSGLPLVLPFQKSAKVKYCFKKIPESSDLKLLQLFLGAGVEDVGRVWVGRGELSCLQPVFKARVVVQELTPETPGFLDPDSNKINFTSQSRLRKQPPASHPLVSNCTSCPCSPHPPLHRHGTDVPPATVQTAGGLLDRVILRVATTGVSIVEQDVTQRQHRRHALCVLLDVPLQILQVKQHRHMDSHAARLLSFTHQYNIMLASEVSLAGVTEFGLKKSFQLPR